MTFTKITAAGIGTTESVTLDGLSVINNGSFGGNLTVGGVLTYEDVTNVDSVGLITARNGIVVGSGITLSKDGDVFFTGIATGNGSGLTALNASNISSGTVPTARLGSGTASSSTFLRGDSTFQTVNTDLVSDTSPQLGGTLDANGNNIQLGDNGRLRCGASQDLDIYHDTHSYIENDTGHLYIRNHESNSSSTYLTLKESQEFGIFKYGTSEWLFKGTVGGSTEMWYDGSKMLYTHSTGAIVKRPSGGETQLTIYGSEGNDAHLLFAADDGDDNADYWRLAGSTDGSLYIQNYTSGAWEKNLKATGNAGVKLYYDNSEKFETTSDGATQYGNLTIPDTDAKIILKDGNNFIQFLNTDKEFKFMNAWGAGEFTFYPGGSERVRINPNGLLFNGDTASGNALDDYEEGTWTPQVHDGTISYLDANYTKIGRQVTVVARIYNFSNNSANDAVRIKNLPFDAAVQDVAAGSVMYSYGGNSHYTTLYMNSSNQLNIYGGHSGAFDQLRHNELNVSSGTTDMYIIATYFAAT